MVYRNLHYWARCHQVMTSPSNEINHEDGGVARCYWRWIRRVLSIWSF